MAVIGEISNLGGRIVGWQPREVNRRNGVFVRLAMTHTIVMLRYGGLAWLPSAVQRLAAEIPAVCGVQKWLMRSGLLNIP